MNEDRRGSLVRVVAGLIAAAWLLGAASPARASDFHAIVWNLTGAKNPEAYIDVGVDTRSAPDGLDISFRVTDVNGSLLSAYTLPVSTGFVSSAFAAPPDDNIFAVSAGEPALVRVRVASGNNFYAVLRQTLKSAKIALAVPPDRGPADNTVAMGTLFPVPLGAFSRAVLLVANVSGGDQTVDVFVGTHGRAGDGKYSIPRLKNQEIAKLEIDPADAYSHLVLKSTGNIVAQLAIQETPKTPITQLTLLPNSTFPGQ